VNRARTLIALAALALIAALAFWWIRNEAPAPQAADRGSALRESAAPAEPPAPKIELAGTQIASPEREAIEVALPAAVAADPAPPTIRGRLIVIERDGSELTDVDGKLDWTAWTGELGRSGTTEIVDGSWSITGPALLWKGRAYLDMKQPVRAAEDIEMAVSIDALSFDGVFVDNRRAAIESPLGKLAPPFPDEIVVRARLAADSVLRVVDAVSGADLDGVTFVEPEPFPMEGARHPGAKYASRIFAKDLRSPIALDELVLPNHPFGQDGAQFLVGAEGYAWDLVQIDRKSGGERVLALERGADLALDVRGVEPKAGASLRLRADGGESPLLEVDLRSDGPLELLGIPAGKYRAVAEIGPHWRSPLVLGEVPLELRAGERTEAVLELTQAPTLELASASGMLYVPEAWKASSLQLSLELLDTPLGGREAHRTLGSSKTGSARAGFDAYYWMDSGLQVGRYELELFRPQFSFVFEVSTGGRTGIELTVPPPVELLVHVVDDVTGMREDAEQLTWHSAWPEGVTGGGLESAERTGPGEFRIRAPAAEVELMLWVWKYQPYSARVDLSSGVVEHTIRLQKGCGFELSMMDGETPIAFPDDWQGEIKTVYGNGRATLRQYAGFVRKIMVSEPGTYALEMPQIPGYEPIPKQAIEVSAGQFTKRVVALERAH
jgi:hypothetical protein